MEEKELIIKIIKLHARWHAMRRRCSDRWQYKNRKIEICEEWKKSKGIEPFIIWGLKSGFEDHLVLDRIDNSKGYSPENCRWTTVKENCNNGINNVYVFYKGKEYSLKQLSEHKDCVISYALLLGRRKTKNWSLEKIIKTPPHGYIERRKD